jgi:hypothetical protein
MTLMNFLCRCFSSRCEPPKPEQTTRSNADLGQKEAKDEAVSEEQLRHMESTDRTGQRRS